MLSKRYILRWFLVCTALSQHPNVMFYLTAHSTEFKSNLFVTNHIPYLRGVLNYQYFSNSLINLIFTTAKLFHQVIKLLPLHIHNGGKCFELWIYFMQVAKKILTFCDILHEMKQKMQTSSWECRDWKSSLRECIISFMFLFNSNKIKTSK